MQENCFVILLSMQPALINKCPFPTPIFSPTFFIPPTFCLFPVPNCTQTSKICDHTFFSELGQAAKDLGRTTKRWRCRSLAGSGHLVMDGLTQLTIPRDSSWAKENTASAGNFLGEPYTPQRNYSQLLPACLPPLLSLRIPPVPSESGVFAQRGDAERKLFEGSDSHDLHTHLLHHRAERQTIPSYPQPPPRGGLMFPLQPISAGLTFFSSLLQSFSLSLVDSSVSRKKFQKF